MERRKLGLAAESLNVISNQVVHSESVRKNGRCRTNRSVQLEAPSEASS